MYAVINQNISKPEIWILLIFIVLVSKRNNLVFVVKWKYESSVFMVGTSIHANCWEQLSPNVWLPKLRENSVDYYFDGRVVSTSCLNLWLS